MTTKQKKNPYLTQMELNCLKESLQGIERAKLTLANLFLDATKNDVVLLRAAKEWIETCRAGHIGWDEYNAAEIVAHQMFYHYGQRKVKPFQKPRFKR